MAALVEREGNCFLTIVLGLPQAISVAQLQGHLVLHRHDPFTAVVTANFTTQSEAANEPQAEPQPEADTVARPSADSKAALKPTACQSGAAKQEGQRSAAPLPPDKPSAAENQ